MGEAATIDTAPRDGTHILGKDGFWREMWLVRDQYEGEFWRDEFDSEPEPTHWAPLPDTSPRSDDGDGKPVAWQWKQTDPFSGAPFWHHDQYYNGNRSEVSRPLYLRPSPTRDETIEMCAKWHDEQAAQYDVKRQEWIERGLILAADKCDDLSDNHRRHAASIRSLKSTPDAEGE